MTSKEKWLILLWADSGLFMIALVTNVLFMYFLVIVLSFFIYKNGNKVLFKEYDERKKRKFEKYRVVQQAVEETMRSRKRLKKKKEL